MANKMPPELLEKWNKNKKGGDEDEGAEERQEKRKSARDKARKAKEMRKKDK